MLARSRPDLYGDHGAAQEGVARSLLWERRVLDTHADCLLQVRLVHRCRRRRCQSARPPACLPAYEPPVCTAARYSGLLATLCWHGCGTIETCRGAGVMMWCGVVRTCGCGCPAHMLGRPVHRARHRYIPQHSRITFVAVGYVPLARCVRSKTNPLPCTSTTVTHAPPSVAAGPSSTSAGCRGCPTGKRSGCASWSISRRSSQHAQALRERAPRCSRPTEARPRGPVDVMCIWRIISLTATLQSRLPASLRSLRWDQPMGTEPRRRTAVGRRVLY